jgi:hypothetical protein
MKIVPTYARSAIRLSSLPRQYSHTASDYGIAHDCPNPACGARLPNDLGRCPIRRSPVAGRVVEEAPPGQTTDSVPAYNGLSQVVRKFDALRGRTTEPEPAGDRQPEAPPVARGEPAAATGRSPQSVKDYGGISRLGYFQGRGGGGAICRVVAYLARDLVSARDLAAWFSVSPYKAAKAGSLLANRL